MRKIALIFLLNFCFFGLYAQQNTDTTLTFKRGFVSVSGGFGRLLAEDWHKLPFIKEMRPLGAISGGGWITPVWGIRGQIGFGETRGFALWAEGTTQGDPGRSGGNWYIGQNYAHLVGRDKANSYIEAFDPDPNIRAFIKNTYLDLDNPRTGKNGAKGYNYYLTYFSLMTDLMINLNNVFWKYDGKEDFFQVMPFAGLGWVHTIKDGNRTAVNSIGLRAGINTGFRITQALSFNIESHLLVVPEVFDRFVGGDKTQDGLLNFVAGFTYKFGKVSRSNKEKILENRIAMLNKQLLDCSKKQPVIIPAPVVAPEPECQDVHISGVVRDKDGNALADAAVFVLNTVNNTVSVLRSDANGAYDMIVPCGASLVLKGAKDAYSEDCFKAAMPSDKTGKTLERPLPQLTLEKFKVGQIFKLENIYYDFDKWNIRPDAAIELDKAVQFLKDYPQITVELGSHTDSRGTAVYNEKLSQRRAESAVAYIVTHGISNLRIKAKGYGERVLVNECKDGVVCTEEQHQANRRTELKVTNVETPKTPEAELWNKYRAGQLYNMNYFPEGFFSKCK